VVVAAYAIQSPVLVRIACLSEVNFYISYFITSANAIPKLSEDGAEAPEHVEALCNII
jgi:hypothetical protein